MMRTRVDPPTLGAWSLNRAQKAFPAEPSKSVIPDVVAEEVTPEDGDAGDAAAAAVCVRYRDPTTLAGMCRHKPVGREGGATIRGHGIVDRGSRIVLAPLLGGITVALVDPHHEQVPRRVHMETVEAVPGQETIVVDRSRPLEASAPVQGPAEPNIAGESALGFPSPGDEDSPAGVQDDLGPILAVRFDSLRIGVDWDGRREGLTQIVRGTDVDMPVLFEGRPQPPITVKDEGRSLSTVDRDLGPCRLLAGAMSRCLGGAQPQTGKSDQPDD